MRIGCFGEENKSRIGELIKMKTVRMTVIIALCLLISQVIQNWKIFHEILLEF